MGDQFAAERPAGSRLRQTAGERLPPASDSIAETPPIGNWLKTYPVTPPQQTAVIPPEASITHESAPASRFYARAEYLLWWTKNDHTPPLVTTGSTTAQAGNRFDGAIGNPDTVVLFGGTLSRNPFSGGLFTAGYALDECGNKFIELNGFFLGPQSSNFSASSAQFPLLTRPFFAVNGNIQQEVVEVVTRPGAVVGNIAVRAPSQLWGLEPNLICKCLEGCNYRVDYLVGARYLNLRESVTVTETFMAQPTPLPIFDGQQVVISDRFATTNQFYGGQVGVQGTWQYDRFSLQGQAKLAAGISHEKSSISASFNFPGNVDPRPGGLLALGSNIGDISRDRFAVVPELGARLGYNVTDALRLTVGYRFIYWSSVVRPGDQIDRNLDVTQIPNFQIPPGTNPVTPARPAALFKETDYWAQGLTFGVEFRY